MGWGWPSPLVVMEGGRGVENIQGEPLDKKLSQRSGGGVDGGYKLDQGEHIPLSRNRIPGPGALRD